MALLSNGEVVVGALYEGQTVPAVTIFGWDDVLCPTTHAKHERAKRTAAVFEGRGLAATQSSKEQRKELVKVGVSVVRCVQAAKRHGPVVIVTESDEQWVRHTAELLLPGAAAACLKSVEVVSSKERFGKEFPGQPACWQIAAFSYVTNRHLLGAGVGAGVGLASVVGSGGVRSSSQELNKIIGSCCSSSSDPAAATVAVTPPGKHAGKGGAGGGGAGHGVGDVIATGRSKVDGRGGNGSGSRCENGSGDAFAERGTGTLVAVSTASRAREDKSAMRTLRDHHPKIVGKTVALIQGPTAQELRNQLDLLSESFAWMFGHPRPRPCAPTSSHRQGKMSAVTTTATNTTKTSTAFGSAHTPIATSRRTATMTNRGGATAAAGVMTSAASDRNRCSPTITATSSCCITPIRVDGRGGPAWCPVLSTSSKSANHAPSLKSLHNHRHPYGNTHVVCRKPIERCDTGGTSTTETNTVDTPNTIEDGEFVSWGEVHGGSYLRSPSGGASIGGGLVLPAPGEEYCMEGNMMRMLSISSELSEAREGDLGSDVDDDTGNDDNDNGDHGDGGSFGGFGGFGGSDGGGGKWREGGSGRGWRR